METSTKYLLVGGGMASVWAAQNIRERDKEGRIVIATEESRPPYDKPPLSKNYLANQEIAEDDAYSKFDNFYPDNNIELLFATELAQDPLKLLQSLSRNRTIVAAWPGNFDGAALTYAEPGHPEARRTDGRPERDRS